MYRILIADDEGLMLEAFKGVILAEFGDKCSVETAKTGRAVIEKAETFHPDIVFMDIHMPGINGIQAMRNIINLRKKWKGICSQVPFIVLKYRQGCI